MFSVKCLNRKFMQYWLLKQQWKKKQPKAATEEKYTSYFCQSVQKL